MATTAFDRWLKDAESWAQEDDWDPDEYLKWVKRLGEAKANLDETFTAVDEHLLKESYKIAEKHAPAVMKSRPSGDFNPVSKDDISLLVVRYIIAYHFYQRSQFEEVPEKALVKRVQMHLAPLQIPMLDIDVAQMLQYAADRVPIEQAVEKSLRDYVKEIRKSAPIVDAYDKDDLGYCTPRLITLLLQTRVDGGPVDRSKLDEIFRIINKVRVEEDNLNPFPDRKLQVIKTVLSTDEKVETFLKRRAEPLVRGSSGDNHAATALERIIDAGDLKALIDLAVSSEKQYCSWDATVGPAIKALKRLGRSSSGKDFEKLAVFAKEHQKP